MLVSPIERFDYVTHWSPARDGNCCTASISENLASLLGFVMMGANVTHEAKIFMTLAPGHRPGLNDF